MHVITHYFNDFSLVLLLDMDTQDSSGNTALHITVEEDAFDAMNYLLSMYVRPHSLLTLIVAKSFILNVCVRGVVYFSFFSVSAVASVQIF